MDCKISVSKVWMPTADWTRCNWHQMRDLEFQRYESMTAKQPHTHTHTRLTALCPGLPRSASTRKVKQIWILLKQETVSGSGISWATCKSAPCSRQITTPAPHHSVFYRPDALPAAQPTASKHWSKATTHTHLTALFLGLPSEPVPERQSQSGFYWSKRQWVAVASAGPYANLHLAPDR